MPENYSRENTNRASNKNSNSNSSNSKNSSNKTSGEASNVRTPMSKQNAAQRKTQDCDR